MTENRLPDYLEHMRQAASDACTFVDGLTKSEFLADKRTQQAVIMSLIIVGEAATKAMDRHPDFTDRHPEVPWRSIRGMRNRIAHGYFDVNLGKRRPRSSTRAARENAGGGSREWYLRYDAAHGRSCLTVACVRGPVTHAYDANDEWGPQGLGRVRRRQPLTGTYVCASR